MSTESQKKETTTAEAEGEEQRANGPSSTAEVEGQEQRANGPSSTAEVAKELERSKPGARSEQAATTLFPEDEANDFHKHWTDIQTGFVDEPRRAVEQADALVAEVVKRLANSFAEARAELEGQWGRGDN